MTDWIFGDLKKNHYGVVYCDPPWSFNLWWNGRKKETPVGLPSRATKPHYSLMREEELINLPVMDLAAEDCLLIMWVTWPVLESALRVMGGWGFEYKTCAFSWMKAWVNQSNMFRDDADANMGLGYWTRSNSEVALLGTRGKPKRIAKDVRQGIIEPKREHSRKPDCVYERIDRLVGDVPKCELFARKSNERYGWTFWGNETTKFNDQKMHDMSQEVSGESGIF